MKTIFITIYDGDTEKNILRSGVFPAFKKSGLNIVLLVKSKKLFDYYKHNFSDHQTTVEIFPPSKSFSERIYFWLGWNTIPTYSIFLRRKELYLYHHKNIVRYAIENVLGFLGRFRMWRKFLRWIYFNIPDNYCRDLLEKYKPDLVFAPSMFSYEDGRLIRYARKLGIKTITTVKSWDVLTTKAFTRVLADRILVFNEYNKKEAVEIGDYKPEQVVITGMPQFDIYAKKEIFLSREDFFKQIGADLNKKLILYSSPGNWKSAYDHEVLLGLHEAIGDGKVKGAVQALVRFHPKYSSTSEYLSGLPYFITERPGTYLTDKMHKSLEGATDNVFQWTFNDKDIIHLANSIYHSDVTINTESTMTLDAAALDKPIIIIGYDGFQKLDYWQSILRKYKRNHYQYVMKTGGVRLAKSEDELIKYTNLYLENPSLDSEGREEIRKKLLFKVDGRSSERVAKAVVDMLN